MNHFANPKDLVNPCKSNDLSVIVRSTDEKNFITLEFQQLRKSIDSTLDTKLSLGVVVFSPKFKLLAKAE